MNQVKVDYILGRRQVEITGMQRYALEIVERAGESVDGLLIDYDVGALSRFLGRFPALVHYPIVVARSRREGSIVHFCSHIQAHLLNYQRLRPSVVTCLDIYPFLNRDHPLSDRCMVRLALRGMLKAEGIIAISDFTKEEVIRVLGYPEDRIYVTPLGVDHEVYKPVPGQDERPRRDLPPVDGKTVLYVGSEQPRKNLSVLLQALAAARKERGDIKLLKVGRPQWKGARQGLLSQVEKLGLRDSVTFVDYVPEDVLPELYRAAGTFVFPSRYEGFGLPPLEAMACGCPVISSNAASLPQVIGGAGITLEPDDIEGFAQAICRVLDEADLREEMRRKGYEQAAKFSWQQTASMTMEVYAEILRGQ